MVIQVDPKKKWGIKKHQGNWNRQRLFEKKKEIWGRKKHIFSFVTRHFSGCNTMQILNSEQSFRLFPPKKNTATRAKHRHPHWFPKKKFITTVSTSETCIFTNYRMKDPNQARVRPYCRFWVGSKLFFDLPTALKKLYPDMSASVNPVHMYIQIFIFLSVLFRTLFLF